MYIYLIEAYVVRIEAFSATCF